MMPVRLRQIVDSMVANIQAPGCHLVQKWLPDVRPRAVNERDLCFLATTEPVSQLSCAELQPGCTAADDDDLVDRRLGGTSNLGPERARRRIRTLLVGHDGPPPGIGPG